MQLFASEVQGLALACGRYDHDLCKSLTRRLQIYDIAVKSSNLWFMCSPSKAFQLTKVQNFKQKVWTFWGCPKNPTKRTPRAETSGAESWLNQRQLRRWCRIWASLLSGPTLAAFSPNRSKVMNQTWTQTNKWKGYTENGNHTTEYINFSYTMVQGNSWFWLAVD